MFANESERRFAVVFDEEPAARNASREVNVSKQPWAKSQPPKTRVINPGSPAHARRAQLDEVDDKIISYGMREPLVMP